MKLRSLVIWAFLISWLARPAPVWAQCCQVATSPPTEFKLAGAVFRGTVTSIRDYLHTPLLGWVLERVPGAEERLFGRHVSFKVNEAWKGVTATSISIRTGQIGAGCGYPFRVGQGYVVYAYQVGDSLVTNTCMRTVGVNVAAIDLRYLSTVPSLPLATPFRFVLGLSLAFFALAGLGLWVLWWATGRRHGPAERKPA